MTQARLLIWVSIPTLMTLVFALAILGPGFMITGLSYTPPFPGEVCSEVYPTHLEVSGDVWLEDPVNGAQCFHMWPVLHFGSSGPHWSSFAVCTCVK